MVWNGRWIKTRRALGFDLTGTHEAHGKSFEGRYWLRGRAASDDELGPRVLDVNFVHRPLRFQLGAGIQFGGEDGQCSVHAELMGTSLWLSFGKGEFEKPDDRTFVYSANVEWYETSSLVSFINFGDTSDRIPYEKRRNRIIDWSDLIFGDRKYTEGEGEGVEVEIPMPERAYKWRLVVSVDKWERPRWPWAKRVTRVHADCLPGEQIPIPGKGENAWDCDEDALFGFNATCTGLDDAVAKIMDSATRSRIKYGGLRWQPEKVRTQVA